MGPADEMPPEYWQSVLRDPRGNAVPSGRLIHQLRLSDIKRHVLRVACRRCDRAVEIQTSDALRLYGPATLWKDAGRRLLDDTCRERTGNRDEDGCWPSFD
jgi:hypothetical protein